MIARRILNFVMQPAVLALLGILVIVLLALGWCAERKDAAADRTQAAATGKALDTVARETPVIRQEQEEKKREVDQIEGSDQRLPDGYGAELERVRRNGHRDP